MKKAFSILLIAVILLGMIGCSSRELREELTPEAFEEAFADTDYATFRHEIEQGTSGIPHTCELKVYRPENESRDYLVIYFFTDEQAAKAFADKNNGSSGMLLFLSLLFGEAYMPKYDRYGTIVVESDRSASAPSRKDMLKTVESVLYGE